MGTSWRLGLFHIEGEVEQNMEKYGKRYMIQFVDDKRDSLI
jgi:hypothetical protein